MEDLYGIKMEWRCKRRLQIQIMHIGNENTQNPNETKEDKLEED